MARKTFDSKSRISSLLDDNDEERDSQVKEKISKVESPKKSNTIISLSIDKDLLDKVKAMAYWEREFIKDIINRAVIEEVNKYEEANGEIKKLPKKK